MSTTTLMNMLPKHLREELKKNHLYPACFTDETKQHTVKEGFEMLVPSGMKTMVELRQELLLVGYTTKQTETAITNLLREIEVLRYVGGLIEKGLAS